MPTMNDIGAHRERLTERLARVDAQRAKLTEELAELDAAERVLSRLMPTNAAPRRRKSRTRKTAAAESSAPSSTRQRKTKRGERKAGRTQAMPLRDASLRAVEALGSEASAEQIRDHLRKEFGLRVLPLHLGRALQSHRRAGRIEQHDGRWSVLPGEREQAKAAE